MTPTPKTQEELASVTAKMASLRWFSHIWFDCPEMKQPINAELLLSLALPVLEELDKQNAELRRRMEVATSVILTQQEIECACCMDFSAALAALDLTKHFDAEGR